MNKRIYSILAALAVTVSSTVAVFADGYEPFTAPRDNGYFEFSEDFSECTNIAEEGGNSYVGTWQNIYAMNEGTPVISREDGVKWTVSTIKSAGGGVNSAAYVNITNPNNKLLYVKGGGANQGMVRLDLTDAMPSGLAVKDLPQDIQEFEFDTNATSRSAAVGLFINGTDSSYVQFGTKNGEGVSSLPSGAGAFVRFVQGGSESKVYTFSGPTTGAWKVKAEAGIISWTFTGGGKTWTGSNVLDSSYIDECKYLAGFFGGGDHGGYMSSFKYRTGNIYTEDMPEPAEAVYLNTFDKTMQVNPDSENEEEKRIYELTEPTVVRRVEYQNYTGGTFELSEDGVNWDVFDRDYVKNTEDEDPDNDENKGKWTAKNTAVTGVNRWVNTCNIKEYKYIKVPTGERVALGRKTGSVKVFKNISRNSTVILRKTVDNAPGTLDLYLSKDDGWANSGFTAVSSDSNYVSVNNADFVASGRSRLIAHKETYAKDQANTPIIISMNGQNNTYEINVSVKGPLSDAIENENPDDLNAYFQTQQEVFDYLNQKISSNAKLQVQKFFTDITSEREDDGTPRKSINNIDACDANDFSNVDAKYAERIMTYSSFTITGTTPVEKFASLDDILSILSKEILVGEFNDMGAAQIPKVDDDGNPVVDDDGNQVYYTTDEIVASVINKNALALDLPVDNKYYRKDTDTDGDGILDDSDFAEVIRGKLSNRTYASAQDLNNAVDEAIVMAVFDNNSNAPYMMEMLETYRNTLGIADGSADAQKLDNISKDTTESAKFVQSIKAAAAAASANFDTPAKIGAFISAYNYNPATPTPSVRPTPGGSGSGGGVSSVKTPNGTFSQADKTVAPRVQVFGDVPLDYWGYEAVRFMNAKGAVKGYEDGNFYPDNQITKAEFVQMLMKVFNPAVEITEDYVNPFNDVKDGDWFANSIVRANIYGIFSGNGESAEPNKPITRQEMASLIYRMTQKQGKALSRSAQVSKFNDEADIAEWAYTPVMEMQAAGIISGDNGNFAPNDNATRAMAAQMLYKTMQGYEKPASATEVPGNE